MHIHPAPGRLRLPRELTGNPHVPDGEGGVVEADGGPALRRVHHAAKQNQPRPDTGGTQRSTLVNSEYRKVWDPLFLEGLCALDHSVTVCVRLDDGCHPASWEMLHNLVVVAFQPGKVDDKTGRIHDFRVGALLGRERD